MASAQQTTQVTADIGAPSSRIGPRIRVFGSSALVIFIRYYYSTRRVPASDASQRTTGIKLCTVRPVAPFLFLVTDSSQ